MLGYSSMVSPPSLQVAGGGLLLATTACSLLTHWDINGLPCQYNEAEKAYACQDGYSCTPRPDGSSSCLADHSLSVGDACWTDRQCPADALCPARACLQSCGAAKAYLQAGGCPSGTFCGPFVSSSGFADGQAHDAQVVGACTPSSDCQAGSACATPERATGNICVALEGDQRACLPSCQINFVADRYQDNCGVLLGATRSSCAPIGAANAQALVCVQATVGARQVGEACDNGAGTPCQSGSSCYGGSCALYCEPSDTAAGTCPSGQQCCHVALNPAKTVGFCATTCVGG